MLETIGAVNLVILDAENNEGWVMSTAENVTAIASNFPDTLVHGGAILDGYLFVMDEDGIIYNSAIDDPTTFPASGFIEAERENDKGVYLGKHHDHIVAFGTRTIEFLYDGGNSTGSPLNRRQDVSYNVGLASGLSVWENGDIIYFIGSNTSGQLQVYKLENFQISPISNDTLNSYITQGLTQEGLNIILNGISSMGHDTILMTVYTLTGAAPGEIDPKITISYDSRTGLWGFWKTTVNSQTYFPLMAWTKRTGGQNPTVAARTGEGILYNGDIINVNDNLVPVDSLLGSGVYEDGVYETDIYLKTDTSGDDIEMVIRTGMQWADTRKYKFQNSLTIISENMSSGKLLTVKMSDEDNASFVEHGTIDMSVPRKELHQGGRFVKRNFQFEYTDDEQLYIDECELDVVGGL